MYTHTYVRTYMYTHHTHPTYHTTHPHLHHTNHTIHPSHTALARTVLACMYLRTVPAETAGNTLELQSIQGKCQCTNICKRTVDYVGQHTVKAASQQPRLWSTRRRLTGRTLHMGTETVVGQRSQRNVTSLCSLSLLHRHSSV